MNKKQRQLLAATAVVGFVLPAAAYNFGSTGDSGSPANGVWLTNNQNFWVVKRNLEPTSNTNVDNAMADVGNNTGGFNGNTVTSSTSCAPDSMAASYDVCTFDGVYSGVGFWGWNYCSGWGGTSGSHPNAECELAWVQFNLDPWPNMVTQGLACHELGHSAGLQHRTSGTTCMISPPGASTLDTHDRNHLISEY